jgi:hypothetical protein
MIKIKHISTLLVIFFTIPVLFAQKKPELFVLSIGIEKYKDATLNLNYAADDAKDIAAMFRKQTALWDVKEVKVLTDAQAKATDIVNAIAGFQKKVTSDDYFVFVFSGHGIEGRLVPYDYDNNLYRSTISKEEILTSLDALGCGYLLFLDACHSGSFAKGLPGKDIEVATHRSKVDKATKDLVDALSGSDKPYLIFGSSGTDQKSWECKSCGHGYFAQAVLWAFENKAVQEGKDTYLPDADKDGFLSVSELDNYLKESVRILTKNTGSSPQKVYSRLTMGKDINLTTWLKSEKTSKSADQDNDGVPDEIDQCPTMAGAAASGGCPEKGKAMATKITELCIQSNKKYSLGCKDGLAYLYCNGGFLSAADFRNKVLEPGSTSTAGIDFYRDLLSKYKVTNEADILAVLKINPKDYLLFTANGFYSNMTSLSRRTRQIQKDITYMPYTQLANYVFDADNNYVFFRNETGGKWKKQLIVRCNEDTRGLKSRELIEFLRALVAAYNGE